jgi:hypothetical protein
MGRIRVGKPDVAVDMSGHVFGIHEGNKGPYDHEVGHHKDGTSDARRSTGIRPRIHNAILKVMPNISPG